MAKITIIMPPFSIKSTTNNGDVAKQIFYATTDKNSVPALMINKKVLSQDAGLFKEGWKLIKIYKGKGLFEKDFSIKLSTLKVIINLLDKYLRDAEPITDSSIETTQATRLLTTVLQNDTELWDAYRANIAMAFYDAYDSDKKHYKNKLDISRIANEAAQNFLTLWCEK